MVIIWGLQWLAIERGQVSKGVCSWLWVRALLGDPGIPVHPWLHGLVQAAPALYGHVSGLLIMSFVWLAG